MKMLKFLQVFLIAAFISCNFAYAADKEIKDFTNAATANVTDEFLVQRNAGDYYRMDIDVLKAYIIPTSLTANRVVITNGSSVLSTSTVTNVELGYLSGATSAIQTQLNNKQGLDAQLTALAAASTSTDVMTYWVDATTLGTFPSTSFTRGFMNSGDGHSAATYLGLRQEYCMALSNAGPSATDLTTGTNVDGGHYFPDAFTINSVRAYVQTAPTGSTIIVDVNAGGTTIFTTNKLTIDASEKTSITAATPPNITTTSIAANTEVTFDIDQKGSTIAGKGLKVCLDITY